MSITRNSLNNPKLNEIQKEHIRKTLEKNMACDLWTKKSLKKVGILLTSHPKNRAFLKSSVWTHKKLGYWLTVVYDNYWNPSKKEISFDEMMPDRETFDLIDNFLISKQQDWGGVIFPYFWMLKFGLQSLTMFDYIYHANGDCIIEKPENFHFMLDEMIKNDYDFYPIGWDDNESKPMCNTTGFIIRTPCVEPLITCIQEKLIPFEVYEKYCSKLGSGEVRFADAALQLDLDIKKPQKNPINLQLSIPGGTWYDIIGFRHIHGEYKAGILNKNEDSIPWNYIDKKYL